MDFLRPSETQFIRKKILITAEKIRSLKLKTKEQKYKFVELLIPTLNKLISFQFLLILLEGANHEQSLQNN